MTFSVIAIRGRHYLIHDKHFAAPIIFFLKQYGYRSRSQCSQSVDRLSNNCVERLWAVISHHLHVMQWSAFMSIRTLEIACYSVPRWDTCSRACQGSGSGTGAVGWDVLCVLQYEVYIGGPCMAGRNSPYSSRLERTRAYLSVRELTRAYSNVLECTQAYSSVLLERTRTILGHTRAYARVLGRQSPIASAMCKGMLLAASLRIKRHR